VLDLKLIRENPQAVQESLNLRGGNYEIEPILQLDRQQRELEGKRSQLQARSNEIAKLIGQKRKSGLPLESPEIQTLQAEGNEVGTESNELQAKEKDLKAQIEALLLPLPNLPASQRRSAKMKMKTSKSGAGETNTYPKIRGFCHTGKSAKS
jgi:seryl-tRNA synthetase